jgi:hypothetical protein
MKRGEQRYIFFSVSLSLLLIDEKKEERIK